MGVIESEDVNETTLRPIVEDIYELLGKMDVNVGQALSAMAVVAANMINDNPDATLESKIAYAELRGREIVSIVRDIASGQISEESRRFVL